MKKYFITSDVHGFYEELMSALGKKGWEQDNPDHIFVSLGDLLDRGPDAVKCLEFVNDLPFERKILIRGNHEDLMEQAMARGEFWMHDIHNGTNDTCYQIVNNLFRDDKSVRAEWMSDKDVLGYTEGSILWEDYAPWCVDYAEIGDNIFVHGWIPCFIKKHMDDSGNILRYYTFNPDWRNSNYKLWDQARWINGMEAWDNGIIEPGKTIWCGHWHASWGNANLHEDGVEFLDRIETYYLDENGVQQPHENHHPFKDEGIVAMDSCCAHSHFLNCEVLETDDCPRVDGKIKDLSF